MIQRTLTVYGSTVNWNEVLQQELKKVGYDIKHIGRDNYVIMDGSGVETDWRLREHNLTLETPKNKEDLAGICTVTFDLTKCSFEIAEKPKVLYITSGISGAYIAFVEFTKR